MALEFRLPELGENITSGTVTKVMIAAGDTVAVDQPVIELETEKAVVEVPSSVAGKVVEVGAKAGQTIHVGDVVFVAEAVEATATAAKAAPAPKEEAAAPEPPTTPRKAPENPPEPSRQAAAPRPAALAATAAARPPILAAPSVRRLAREQGVDLSRVTGSGPMGRITTEDVRAFQAQGAAQPKPETSTVSGERPEGPAVPAKSDRDRWGAIERQPMSAVRRKTALHMTAAWETIPYVTQFDLADITFLEQCRKQYAPKVEAAGAKLTITVLVLRALGICLGKFPKFNAVVDMENEQIVLKKYISIGVAVDTENGLLVPVVRNADQKSIIELAVEVAALAEKARTRKLTLEDMQGGTFTLTNLGGIGGTGFTPIINAPEVAVLGLSRSRVEPVFSEGAFVPRTMLPLSLSYDHRIIDGADAARFTRFLSETLEHGLQLFLGEANSE